jgi:putative transposase
MPRKARIDTPGALHHIIIRGIERNDIFKDSQDYSNFLTRFGTILTETATSCYAWALIPNHIHLLLRTDITPITTVMRRLLTGYAQQFNRRHDRHGYLFQNRYKSFLCETDPYLLELVRYIHLNPIRAGIIDTMVALDKYPQTGHAVIMGKIKQEWQDKEYVLSLFGQNESLAKRAYRSFVKKGISLGDRPDLIGGGLIWVPLKQMRQEGLRVASDERILGSSDFVISVMKKANEDYKKRISAKNLSLDALITKIAHHCGVHEALIKSTIKQRTVSQARAITAHIAIDRLHITGAEIARKLNLTPSTVSKLASRGRKNPISPEIEAKLFVSGRKSGR